MPYKTLMLRLYKPSKFKQEIMDTAILNYTNALQYLLQKYKNQVIELSQSERHVSRGRLLSLIDKDTTRELNDFAVQPFKDSLKVDFAMTAATFSAQSRKRQNTGYPNVMASSHYPLHEFHSLYFGRYALNRDYCLLYDEYTGRFYAKLYLLNRKQSIPYKANASRLSLKYVSAEMTPLLNEAGKKRYLIMPLAFGQNQYNDLKKTLDRPDILRTARLYKKKNKYYLMVSIECESEPPIPTVTTMGVARAPKGGLHYTVSADSEIVTGGPLAYKQTDQKLFLLAKDIVKLAFQYQAQVIIEAGGGKNDKVSIKRSKEPGILTTSEYAKMARILKYKLPEYRLPPPVEVSAHGLYCTCPQCGSRTYKNCLSPEIFACIMCGFASEFDSVGSMNLANRLIKYAYDKVPIYIEDTETDSVFYNKLIGFSGVLPLGSTDYERIYYELSLKVHASEQFEKDTKKYAIMQKLLQSPTMRDAVHIVYKKKR